MELNGAKKYRSSRDFLVPNKSQDWSLHFPQCNQLDLACQINVHASSNPMLHQNSSLHCGPQAESRYAIGSHFLGVDKKNSSGATRHIIQLFSGGGRRQHMTRPQNRREIGGVPFSRPPTFTAGPCPAAGGPEGHRAGNVRSQSSFRPEGRFYQPGERFGF